MDKKEIIRLLRELAQYLEIDGENPFKIRSYIKAAETLEHHDETIEQLIETGKLRSLEGIGEAIEKKIVLWAKNEPVPAYENVKSKYPASLLELFSVQSLGGKRIRALYDHLHITNMDELYQLCLEGKVATVPGFNKKIEAKIIESIESLNQWKNFYLLSDGLQIAEQCIEYLENLIPTSKIFIVGSLRRYCEIVQNINLLIASDNYKQAISIIREKDKTEISNFDSATIIFDKFSIPILLHFADIEDLGTKIVFYTGSKKYVETIKTTLSKKGIRFNFDGLFDNKNQKIHCRDENHFYQITGLSYLPPELREEFSDMDIVYSRTKNLIDIQSIKGIFHCHTHYSDGQNSIEELVNYCISKGFSYLVICDHSQSAGYANGLSIQDIENQHREIDELNNKYKPFKIFKGIECDIKTDGSLDYSNEVLSTFEIVIGSIHTKLDMDINTATERLLKAIENPFLDILGHPTGRLLLSRKGYPVDFRKIIQACVDNGVAIEINANPLRLDLSWNHIYSAVLKGAKFAISVDAHNIDGMEDLKYGVYTARKGTLSPEDVLNCMDIEELLDWLRQRKKKN